MTQVDKQDRTLCKWWISGKLSQTYRRRNLLLSAVQEAGDTFFEISGLNLSVCSPEGSLTATLLSTLRKVSVSLKRNLLFHFENEQEILSFVFPLF